MRIAFLSWRDATHPDAAGAEAYVQEVGQELVRRGHEVTIVCAEHERAPQSNHLNGVRVVRLGGRISVLPSALVWLVVRRRRIDAVVDVIDGVPFWTPLVRRRGLVALVPHLHRERWLTTRVYRRLPHVTVSESGARDLAGLGVPSAAITVAHYGLRIPRVPASRSASPLLSVAAGRAPGQQVEHAVEVASSLRAEFPDLRLDVMGDGPWRERLEEEVERRGVGDVVRLRGNLTAAERGRLLAESWLLLVPSAREAWGQAVMEAAAQGTPSVAYRASGGVAESVVDGVTGLLVDDLPEMTERVRQLLHNPWTRARLGDAALTRSAGFDWSETAGRVERVLQEAAI